MLQLIEISFICAGIHVCFMEGMIFDYLRLDIMLMDLYEKYPKWSAEKWLKIANALNWIQKPLYDCLPCMASFWTCIILWKIDIKSMLIVCGMNAIIASLLQFFDNTKLPENE